MKEKQDEIKKLYDPRLIALEGKRKVLGDKIKLWQNEQKKIHGSDKVPKAKKSDPICKDFL